MSNFVAINYDVRTSLIFCYPKNFKGGDFDVRNKERGRPPKNFEDAELQALLDKDDDQTQERLVNGDRYQQRLADLNHAIRPKYEARQHKVIFLDDNAQLHHSIATCQLGESYNWERQNNFFGKASINFLRDGENVWLGKAHT
uniref:Putative LOC100903547 [Metaseiulus occidentalis] n=1 Tax=Lepeophtheirus salmonis TaxID=72036 RepID=A0A0K2V3T2_LEPSM